jgi:hypothetical protein
MSVRKRRWLNSAGMQMVAWVCDYRDLHGHRRLKTFRLKKQADRFATKVEADALDRELRSKSPAGAPTPKPGRFNQSEEDLEMNSQTNTTAPAANPVVREWDLLKAIYTYRSEWFGYLARSLDDDKADTGYEPALDALANWKHPAMNWNEAFEALKVAETEAEVGDTPIVSAMIRAARSWVEANPSVGAAS